MRSRPRSAASPPRLSRRSPGWALATALVAILDSVATPAGLGSLYLIAVLAVAIRRGQVAALAAAVLGVLVLNFFFIKPLHQLTIADSDNVVALGVLLLAALVVGRLAGAVAAAGGRGRAAGRAGGGARARGGDARRRGNRPAGRDRRPGRRDLGQPRSRRAEESSRLGDQLRTPAAATARRALRLPTEARPVWLYGRPLGTGRRRI